jgi:hypothetical protein
VFRHVTCRRRSASLTFARQAASADLDSSPRQTESECLGRKGGYCGLLGQRPGVAGARRNCRPARTTTGASASSAGGAVPQRPSPGPAGAGSLGAVAVELAAHDQPGNLLDFPDRELGITRAEWAVSSVDPAVGQGLLEFGHAGLGDLRALEVEMGQTGHLLQMVQAGICNVRAFDLEEL